MDRDLEPEIVVYMGGCCGDLVTALIDPTDSGLDQNHGTVKLTPDRQRLKKPYLFANNIEKKQYINDIALRYQSLPSHDIDYHVFSKHRFTGIAVSDADTASWAAERFRDVHRPEVWHSVQKSCNIQSVDHYAEQLLHYGRMIRELTTNVIDVRDIRQGHAVSLLENMLGRDLDPVALDFYHDWLSCASSSI